MKEKKFWKPGSQKPSENESVGVGTKEKGKNQTNKPGLSKSVLSMKVG
jgi:hypothetical protein